VVVSVNATRDRADERWTLDIADTGIGIPPDRHQYLFEPFEQASASIARVYGGSGLGLALSRRLAEHLGGSLTLLRSAPGEGTVFRLTLKPLPHALESARSRGRDVSNEDLSAIQGLRILLAEDHPDLHEALRRQLQRAGANVVSAHDGEQAVAKAGSADFDVILMDLRLPHMDGLEAIRALRGQGCAVPIIALTADPTSFHREAALEAGCNTCLSKPFEMDELIASIRRLTQTKR
jgi:two-component system, sensor histidine kinase